MPALQRRSAPPRYQARQSGTPAVPSASSRRSKLIHLGVYSIDSVGTYRKGQSLNRSFSRLKTSLVIDVPSSCAAAILSVRSDLFSELDS